MSSPLAAYIPWQVRDSLGRAVFTPLGIFVAMGVLPLWSVWSMHGMEAMRTGSNQGAAAGIYTSVLGLSMTLGAMVAVSGIIAMDRDRQYFRFLFSHQVPPWAYYLQRYVLAAVLFVATMLLIPAGYGAVVSPVPVLAVGAASLLYMLLYGSLAMLCGALLNRDGVAFIGIVIIGNVIQGIPDEAAPAWLRVIGDALPPFSGLGELRDALLREAPLDRGDLLHVLLYSLAMLAAALFIVRRAPLAR
jgi:hypothetical protein